MAGPSLPASAERVRAALSAQGLAAEIRLFDATTRTAADAAAAIGCSVAQIAKSLVFRATPSGRPILVMASGSNRVDLAAIAAALGEAIAKADAGFVRDKTGFAIGGVAPLGHRETPVVFVDRDLLGFAEIWAAAGTPHAVFRLRPDDLVRITAGRVVSLG